ncbi:MAG: CatB-related O-acetyltransferase [Candidatus Pacebacteria bacterium]|nr:CatB-related O-acetyltransferase [Candidatus Paceibacterota bacterium]PIR63836.1 MAG: hypothetical protein COU64_02600 [Candidatus Pacebacteria bacterium CG10_big_fil_rev_8_21_14_0_10_40_26]PIZ78808.1 MAG: hypothetical protein COY01_03350 [Candidatus Pacebacteria bacterium CG_4_10_14_0_2_um_filter_40_20]PJA68791.1 MAG: hypothetical protein CO156_03605 [Candidatus Pacebacteria bacterium CG_4_9_14_3_um_filter_40_12]PJC41168.1 MAG: hypothetical protein CO041_06090 [Candidatus Pacebacteria bacte
MNFLLKLFTPRLFTKDVVPKKFRDHIGVYTYGKPIIKEFGDNGTLTIGNFCSIAKDTILILGGAHRADWITTYPFPKYGKYFTQTKTNANDYSQNKGGIVIGNDVWIGTGVTILPGVRVSDGAIIGTNALITKDVPPYAIVGGNPAKIIKYRFTETEIEKIRDTKWWEWDIQKINEAIDILSSENIDALVAFSQKSEK